MSGEVLYRKWRPQRFSELVGQEAVTRTLRNSVSSGRLAHAYLFCGPRGTGKTSLGRLLAKAANCASPIEGEPCNACDSCRAFLEGRAMDFIEQDAASHNSVDDIRQLRENVVLNPMSGRFKVYLLDEVHMLSNAAENALLKTLEEPPPHILFVLATTESHKVQGTIISRCQRFDLKRISLSAVVQRLSYICGQEGYSLEDAALTEIARAATGSLRDAINNLEQVVSYYGPDASVEQVREALGLNMDARSGQLAKCALERDVNGGLRIIAAARNDGLDMKQFNHQVVAYLRGVLWARAGEEPNLPAEMAEEVKKNAADVDQAEVVTALRMFGRLDFRDDAQSSLPLELALIEMTLKPAAISASLDESRPDRAQATVGVPSAMDSAVSQGSALAGNGTRASGRPSDVLERVRQACRESDKQLAGLLNGSCEVKSIEGDVITVGFYHTFHLERIGSGPLAKRLEELLSEELGKPLKAVYVHSPRTADPGRVSGGHLVQAARELGAKPVRSPGRSDRGDDGERRDP